MIVVVDDDSECLAFLNHILSSAGYVVRPADSGELALAAIRACSPELILLDVQMPSMDGLEVLRSLKARPETREIPVILLSASSDVQARLHGLRLRAADFLTKPLHREEVLVRVHLHVELN